MTTTRDLLAAGFATESAASVRHLWCAQQAEVEGYPAAAAAFRSAAAAAASHAHGLLEFMAEESGVDGDADIGDTKDNLVAAIGSHAVRTAQEHREHAAAARSQGLGAIADWFDTAADATELLTKALTDTLVSLED